MHRALVFFLIAFGPAAAAETWIRLASENFELYTSGRESDARKTLETFEQVRSFFMRTKSEQVTTHLPVTIVGFRNLKEYAPYSINSGAAAYYVGDEQRDFIVMSDLGQEHTPVAIHEYMHLLMRHTGMKLPVWLNEGMAEVYSTLKPLGGQILLGSLPEGRAYVLQRQRWLPIAALMAVGRNSPEYNEKDRMGILYAQSWLLTHMLMLGEGYREQFAKFAERVALSGSAEKAFGEVYGKQLSEVERDLRKYYGSNSLQGVLFKTRFEKVQVGSARPATELETGIALAKLLTFSGRDAEAVQRLEGLAQKYASNPEIPEALAHVYWRRRDLTSARKYFGLAVDRGASNWKTWWDYARLLAAQPDSDDRQMEVLIKTLQLKPDLLDARIALGHELYRKQRYAQALVTLREVRNLDPERAPVVLLTMAYSALRVKLPEEAKRHAEQAKKYARRPEDIEAAERLVRYVDQGGSGSPEDLTRTTPVIRRAPPRTSPDEPVMEPPPLRSLRGRLTLLECIGTRAKLHLRVGDTIHVLLIRDASEVTIRHREGSTVDMNCGPQDHAVAVEYLPEPDAETKTEGIIRVLDLSTDK